MSAAPANDLGDIPLVLPRLNGPTSEKNARANCNCLSCLCCSGFLQVAASQIMHGLQSWLYVDLANDRTEDRGVRKVGNDEQGDLHCDDDTKKCTARSSQHLNHEQSVISMFVGVTVACGGSLGHLSRNNVASE